MKNAWQKKALANVCQFSNGLWKGEKPPFVNVGVIRNTNFTKEGALDDSDIAYLDVEAKKFETRRLRFGDVILEKSGGGPKQPVGRVVLFDKEDGDLQGHCEDRGEWNASTHAEIMSHRMKKPTQCKYWRISNRQGLRHTISGGFQR